MQNEYIMRLWKALEDTVFSEDGNGAEPRSYDKGIEVLLQIFLDVKTTGNKVFFIGNGGSAAIASHMTADYFKNGGMVTCSLYDSAVMTCLSNDYAYEEVFAKQIAAQAEEGDLLVAVSSSGNSGNIIRALQEAKQKKVKTVTFTGFGEDNAAKQMGDFYVYVPVSEYGIVESIHNLILQHVVDCLLEKNRETQQET